MKRRITAAVLAVALTLGLSPSVLAAEEDGQSIDVGASAEAADETQNFDIGDEGQELVVDEPADSGEQQPADAFEIDPEQPADETELAPEDVAQEIALDGEDGGDSGDTLTGTYTASIASGIKDTAQTVKAQSTYSGSFGKQLSADAAASEAYQKFDTAFSAFLKEDKNTFSCGNKKINLEYESGVTLENKTADGALSTFNASVMDAYAAYYYDHPEAFFLAQSVTQIVSLKSAGTNKWKITDVELSIEMLFSGRTELKNARTKYNAALDNAVAYANKGTSRYLKLRYAHNYLCESTVYASSASRRYSPYGALVDGKAVCEGYARAYKAICDQLNIPCACVSGTGYPAAIAHMWNYVQMTDKKWYGVDTTWDDDEEGVKHYFFLSGSLTNAMEYTGDKAHTFGNTHRESGRFYEDAQRSFTYPALTSSQYLSSGQVTISKESAQLEVGDTLQLKATASREGKTPPMTITGMTWSSSKTSVATVSSSGKVTAVAAGTATITAKTADFQATCAVTVIDKQVTKITMDKTATISLTHSKTLKPVIEPSGAKNAKLSWSTSDSSVATVSSGGKVTGVKEGTATITAMAESGVKATCSVTVKYFPLTSISLSKTSASVKRKSKLTLTATANPANASTPSLKWSSANTAIATVSQSGVVTGVKEGKTTITVSGEGGVKAACTVTVTPIPVESVSINLGSSYQMYTGKSATAKATIKPSDSTVRAVEWTSSNQSVATITVAGTIKAIKAGKTTITAKADGKSASCTLTVTPKLATPKLSSIANKVYGVQLKWKTVSKAAGYGILRKESGQSWDKAVKMTVSGQSTKSYTDKTAKNGKNYVYTVYALYSGVKSSDYDTTGLSTQFVATPSLNTLTNLRDGLQLRWGKVDGASGYKLYRKTASAKKWTQIKTIQGSATTKYVDKTAKNDTVYTYTVRAFTKSGQSYYHTKGITQRRVGSASIKSLRAPSKKTITVKWKTVSKASGYQVKYSTDKEMGKATTVSVSGQSESSKNLTKLKADTRYYVRVRAYRSVGGKKIYGAWSAQKSVKTPAS